MERFKQGCFYGCMGGLGLYIAEFFCSLLPYMKVSNLLYEIWLITSIVFGVGISTLAMLYKRTSVLEMLLRFCVMGVLYVMIGTVNGYLGVIKYLYEVLGVYMNSASDNVSGMLTITFLTIVICICIVVMIVVTIISLFSKKMESQ